MSYVLAISVSIIRPASRLPTSSSFLSTRGGRPEGRRARAEPRVSGGLVGLSLGYGWGGSGLKIWGSGLRALGVWCRVYNIQESGLGSLWSVVELVCLRHERACQGLAIQEMACNLL